MPKYDYLCIANGRAVEVFHRMSEEVTTWGDLCQRAGIPLDGTPADAAVQKHFVTSNVAASGSLGAETRPPIENLDFRRSGRSRT